MAPKNILKLIYIAGMGFLGEEAANFLSVYVRNDTKRTLIRASGAVTGAYAGLLISDDLDEMISNAIDILQRPEERVEVNNG